MKFQDSIYKLVTQEKKGIFAEFACFFLLVLSWIYGACVFVLPRLYGARLFPVYQAPIPVISIGNITLGGVGKTPLVIKVAQIFKARQIKPTILIRGYMDQKGSSALSDEALMLRETLGDVPVLVGVNRVKNAKEYLLSTQEDPSTRPLDSLKVSPLGKNSPRAHLFILDDGFQHWRFNRDLDIVVIDSTNPWGNGYLLPRGFLRETKGALKRAQIIVFTKVDEFDSQRESIKNEVQTINPKALIVEAVHKPIGYKDVFLNKTQTIKYLIGKSFIGVCAIGDPESFRFVLQSMSEVPMKEFFTFRDHYQYEKKELESIVQYCKSNRISIIVTTQKDAVKLINFKDVFQGIEVLSLDVSLQLTQGEEEFEKRICRIFDA